MSGFVSNPATSDTPAPPSEVELAPCPWCGSEPTHRHRITAHRRYAVACIMPLCVVRPETAWFGTPAESITAWNRRTLDTQSTHHAAIIADLAHDRDQARVECASAVERVGQLEAEVAEARRRSAEQDAARDALAEHYEARLVEVTAERDKLEAVALELSNWRAADAIEFMGACAERDTARAETEALRAERDAANDTLEMLNSAESTLLTQRNAASSEASALRALLKRCAVTLQHTHDVFDDDSVRGTLHAVRAALVAPAPPARSNPCST